MKRLILATLALATLILTAEPALAAPKNRKKAEPKPEAMEFSVAIPSSEIELKDPMAEDEGEGPSIELAYSSWSPDDFQRKSYGGAAGTFRKGSVPYVSVNVRYPLTHFSNGAGFALKGGLSGMSLEREGDVGIGPARYTSTQTLNLFMVRAGIEYQALRFWKHSLQPYVGVAALPTIAMSSKSVFEDRVSELGIPLELTGGLLFRPDLLKDFLGLHHGALGFGAHYILGSIDSSRLDGFGLQGFFQLSL